jgi:UDP-N-acetylglucosamine 1-carboxyvinyltransferase
MRGPHGTSVTGTANVLSAAALARGRTIITSAAAEPEIVDLGRFLNALGAKISGLGTDTIEVEGVEALGSARHRVIPDRIEAGTLLVAVAITGGRASVSGVNLPHLNAVLETLAAAGVDVACGHGHVHVRAGDRPRAIDVTARPYPGLPTDLQAQFMALACLAPGRSTVGDSVFPERFMHVAELNRLGARIQRQGPAAIVDGVRHLSGATVVASDLRASAALVLAGLAARGETVVRRIHHLDRGYQGLEEKLAQLGARVTRDGAFRRADSVHAFGGPVDRDRWRQRRP